jgi:TLC domain
MSCIFVSFVINNVIFYLLPSSAPPLTRSYIVGTIHAIISVLAVCTFFVLSTGNITDINRILGGGMAETNDVIVTYTVCHSTGYFIYDVIVMSRLQDGQHRSAVTHHIVHIVAMILGKGQEFIERNCCANN